jgi:peptidoglycan hydrolase CwlO-like protein
MEQRPENSWHLDKRVPVAFIFALVMQTMTIVWFASQMNAQIQTNQKDIQRLDASVTTLQKEANTQAVQLGRIEEGISGMRRDIQSMFEVLKSQQKN